MGFKEYREAKPIFDNVSDKDLVTALHEKYGEKGESLPTFATKIKATQILDVGEDETEKYARKTPHLPEPKAKFSFGRLGSQVYRNIAQGIAESVHGIKAETERMKSYAESMPKPYEKTMEGDFKVPGINIYETRKPEIAFNFLSDVEKGLFGKVLRKAEKSKGKPLTDPEIEILKRGHIVNIKSRRIKALGEFAESMPKVLPGTSGKIESAIGGIARFGPGMVMTALNLPAGTAMMFNQIYGAKYKELRESGIDEQTSREAAAFTSAISTPLEQAGTVFQLGMMKKLFSNIGAKVWLGKRLRKFVGILLANTGAEGFEEYLQTYPDEIANIYAANVEKSGEQIAQLVIDKFPEIHKKGLEAAEIGAIGGALMAGGAQMAAAPFNIRDYRAEKKAKREVEAIKKELTESINKSKTLTDEERAEAIDILDDDLQKGAEKIQESVSIEEMLTAEKKKIAEAAEKTDKEKLVVAQQKLTVPDIKKVETVEQAKSIVDMYEKMPEADMKRNDKARLKAAINRRDFFERKEEEEEALEPVSKEGIDLRPKQLQVPTLERPVGQSPVKNAPYVGSLFTREDKYTEQGGRSLEIKEAGLESPIREDVLYESGLQRVEEMERRIYEGKWKYQFLLDELLDSGTKVEFFVGDLQKIDGISMPSKQANRGVTIPLTVDKMTGKIKSLRIGLDPAILGNDSNFDYSEGTLVHELIHGIYRAKVGSARTSESKQFFKDISKVWFSIPQEHMDRFEGWALEYKNSNSPDMKKQWDKYTEEEKDFRQTWYQLLGAIKKTGTDVSPDRMRHWEELMTYAFSRPEIMQKLHQIPSGKPRLGEKVKSVWTKLLEVFFQNRLPNVPPSVANELIALNNKVIGHQSIEYQRVLGENIEEQSSYDLLIKKNPAFPKGSYKLQPAFIDLDTEQVWVSPLGHWDIKGAPKGALDGFAAVDKDGKVLKYYTREQAGGLVDPQRTVIDPDSGAMATEDFRDLKVSYEKVPSFEKSTRKRLSQSDKGLLEARKKARGGKTLATVWKEARATNKKAKERLAKERGASRWDKLNPTVGLTIMKPVTLEKEMSRVRVIVRTDLKRGLQPDHGKVRYHESRLQAIEILQQRRAQVELQRQRAVEEKLTQKAGHTEKSKIRFFKAEYKRLKRLDAPYSSVQFTKNNLIDLLGPDVFYKWSGEKGPVVEKIVIAPVPKVKKKVKKGPVIVTKIPSFTEKEFKEREKADLQLTTAKTSKEAAAKLNKVMEYVRNTYIRKGKVMPTEFVDQVTLVLEQAKVFKVVTNEELSQISDELVSAVTGTDVSFESIDRTDTAKKDPIQRVFNKHAQRKVKFDAYYSPTDGYVPAGYSFTITDRNSPAYAASIVVDSLDRKSIRKRIDDAEKLFTKVSFEFEVVEDSEDITRSKIQFKDSSTEVEFVHRTMEGIDESVVVFSYEEVGKEPTFERYRIQKVPGEMVALKEAQKKGIQTIRTIQKMLFNLMSNEYKAKVPDRITFSGSIYDTQKNKTYKAFAKRLAKKLDWTLSEEIIKNAAPVYMVTNPDVKPTGEELVSDDMPYYDDLVSYETQELKDKPFKFKDKKMNDDAAYGEAGFVSPNWFSKFNDYIRNEFKTHFREFKFLKRKEHGELQYQLRQLKKGQTISMRKAAKLLADNIGTLSKEEYSVFNKLSYMMDFYEQVSMNEELRAVGKDVIVKDFPYGWTEKQIKSETGRLWNEVQKNGKVKRAWYTRLDTWRAIRTGYSQSMKDVGFDVDKKLNRVFYFRHQVLDILKAQNAYYGKAGSGGKLAVPTRRSSLRKRKGGAYEMNLNYVQAEFEIMSQMIYDTQIGTTLKTIMDTYGSEEAKEGYSLYKPREDTVFYLANSVPGKMAQDAMEAGLKELRVPTDKIRTVLAMGGKYKGYYLPDKVANTLNVALEKPRGGAFMNGAKDVLRGWKMWQLLSPFRALKYNLRNLTGDAEAMFVGDAATFKYVRKAYRDLREWKKTGIASKELQEWFDRGGNETTLQSQEMGRLLTDPMFTEQLGIQKKGVIAKAWTPVEWSARKVRSMTDMRENLFRYAAYKRYTALLKDGSKPKNYAASMPEEVNAIKDYRDKAFLMSNDLLGAYDRISIAGENFRSYLAPFWSFQEINMKRTLQFARNAIKNDDVMGHIGRKLGAKGVVVPIKIGKFAFKMAMLHTMVQTWNMLAFGDEERALPEEMHRRSHIILGHGKDDIIYFPRIGILGDLLEWAGADTAPTDVIDVIVGDKTIKDVIDGYDYGKENVKDVINKVVQSFGPYVKIPLELLTGEKVFPSIWSKQPITSRGRYIAEQMQIEPLFDVLAGRPTKESHWVDTMIKMAPIYKGDRKRFGWLATQQKVHDYLQKSGQGGSGFIVTDTGTALYNMGVAWRYGDKKAIRKYLIDFIELKTNQYSEKIDVINAIEKQWEKLDPLAKLTSDVHRGLFLASLTKRDQYALGLAYQYYAEIKSGKQFYKGIK